MSDKQYSGPDRRKSLRVTYGPAARARLRVGDNDYQLADISEMGLRFYREGVIEEGQEVAGKVTLLCGESVDVAGMVVRREQVCVYMNVENPVGKSLLRREQEHIDRGL